MIDNLDSFLARSFSPDESRFLRAIIESPRELDPLRAYAEFLASRTDRKCEYLNLMAKLINHEKTTTAPEATIAAAFAELERRLEFPMKMEWCYLVQGQWSIPKSLLPRAKAAAEFVVRVLLEPPISFLYDPMLSPLEWRNQRKRCPASTLLLVPDLRNFLLPDQKSRMLESFFDESGFLLCLRGRKYLSVHDRWLSSDEAFVRKLTEYRDGECVVKWSRIDRVEASRKTGISQSYVQLDLFEKTGNSKTPPVFMHHLMPIFSTWPGFSEVLAEMEVKLKGFSNEALENFPDDGSSAEIWRKNPSGKKSEDTFS